MVQNFQQLEIIKDREYYTHLTTCISFIQGLQQQYTEAEWLQKMVIALVLNTQNSLQPLTTPIHIQASQQIKRKRKEIEKVERLSNSYVITIKQGGQKIPKHQTSDFIDFFMLELIYSNLSSNFFLIFVI